MQPLQKNLLPVVYLAIGTAALCLTCVYYSVCRAVPPALLSWFVIDDIPKNCQIQYLAHSLPTLGHVFAFTVISAAFVDQKLRYIGLCAALWCLTNISFELLSSLQTATVARVLPASVAQLVTLGTFDFGDLGAAVLGAMLAVCVVQLVSQLGIFANRWR